MKFVVLFGRADGGRGELVGGNGGKAGLVSDLFPTATYTLAIFVNRSLKLPVPVVGPAFQLAHPTPSRIRKGFPRLLLFGACKIIMSRTKDKGSANVIHTRTSMAN